MDLVELCKNPTCLDVVCKYLHSREAIGTLLSLQVTCKEIYNLTQPKVSDYFYLRIIGELPFERRTLTSVILHHQALPKKETLLLSPPITRVHYMGFSQLSDNFIPPSVTFLSLSSMKKSIPLPPGFLPPQLTRVRFYDAFDSPVSNNKLPPTLTHIWFGQHFNQKVDHLPPSVTHVIFGSKFNQPVDKLPTGLRYMIVGVAFTQPPTEFPQNLQYLCLGRRYQHSITPLPPSLTHLALLNGLVHASEKLPPNLQYLRLGTHLKHPLPPLPPTITQFVMNPASSAASYPHGEFPNLVTKFKCYGESDITLSQIPANIKHLLLWSNFAEPVENLCRFHSLTSLIFSSIRFNSPVDGKLPPQITHLDLGDNFNHPVDNLPSNLLSLKLGREFNQSIDNLPPKLISLEIEGAGFNQPIKALPSNLQALHLDTYQLTFPNLDFIPPTLQYLHLNPDSNSAEIRTLPHSLTRLSLTTEEGKPIPILALPPHLEELTLSGNYNPAGLGKLLPATLKRLVLGFSFTKPLESLPRSLHTLEIINNKYSHPLPLPLPPTLRYLNQMSPLLKADAKTFPPRLFHVRSAKEYKLPNTCHSQPDHETYMCDWCDQFSSSVIDLGADSQQWRDAFVNSMHLFTCLHDL